MGQTVQPYAEAAANGAFFLGELEKFVHVSPQRFERVAEGGNGPCGLAVRVIGGSGEQVRLAEAIKSPDTCDICWGSEGVKKKVPVFWVEGLGLASEDDSKVQTPVFFDKNDAERFWRQINKDKVR